MLLCSYKKSQSQIIFTLTPTRKKSWTRNIAKRSLKYRVRTTIKKLIITFAILFATFFTSMHTIITPKLPRTHIPPPLPPHPKIPACIVKKNHKKPSPNMHLKMTYLTSYKIKKNFIHHFQMTWHTFIPEIPNRANSKSFLAPLSPIFALKKKFKVTNETLDFFPFPSSATTLSCLVVHYRPSCDKMQCISLF